MFILNKYNRNSEDYKNPDLYFENQITSCRKSLITMLATFLAVVVSAVCANAQTTTSTYKAAVVEFTVDQKSEERVKNNLNGFVDVLETIKNQDVDIVVFPEDAILGVMYTTRDSIRPYLEEIPEPSGSTNPCNDLKFKNHQILRKLSCLASKFKIVLVANMGDVQKCKDKPQCPKDGRYQFNTNVAFDTDGRLIAKYHKQNLYASEKDYFDPGDSSSCVTFDTSFGVKFGTFTCYDLLYKEPGNCLLNKGVKDFVLPTAWGNNFPFYVSIGVQQSWSFKHSVNFLAANQHFANTKKYYSSGSGIYSAGRSKYYISSNSQSENLRKAIVATVPTNPDASAFPQHGTVLNLNDIETKGSGYLSFKPIPIVTEGEAEIFAYMTDDKTLQRSLRCTLAYSMASADMDEFYALGVYIGTRLDDPSFGYAVCSVVRCSNKSDITSCGNPVKGFKAKTVFNKFKLRGTFPKESTVYSTAFESGLNLFTPSDMQVGSNHLVISKNVQLVSASLWARVDPKSEKNKNEL